jgi:MFS family permease
LKFVNLQEYGNHIRAFSRDARLMIVASVILAVGTAAPQVFAALYFRALGFDAQFIGAVSTANQVGGALGTLPAMFAIGRLGRRAAIVLGASVSLLTWGFAMTTPAPTWILVWLAISGAFNVLLGLAIVPVLAESSETYERTTLFAVRDALVWLTLALASVLTGYLPALIAPLLAAPADSALSYRAVLLGSVAVRMIALIPLAMLRGSRAGLLTTDDGRPTTAQYPHPGRLGPDQTVTRPRGVRAYLRWLDPRVLLKLETPVVRVALPFVLVYFAGAMVLPFLPLFLRDKHGADDPLIGTVQGLSYLSIGVCTLLAPLLLQRVGRRALIVGAACFSALCIAAMAFVDARAGVIALAIARAGIFNMVLPVYRALVIDRAPRAEHTIAALVLATAENIGATPAPPLSGRLQRGLGYEPVFVMSALLYGLGALAFFVAAKARKTPEKSPI